MLTSMKRLNLSKIFLSLLVFVGINQTSFASHNRGGNITWECVGPNQYVLTLNFFENCATAFESSSNKSLIITNDCNLPNPSASLPNITYQEEVSQLCPPSLASSACNGGNLPGVWLHQWQDTITLPGCCQYWTFAFSLCCQNTTVNLVGQPNIYFESTLDNCTKPCDFGPVISNPTVPYVCINQLVCYNLGAIETDGDSLSFELASGMSAAGTNVNYQTGYSAAAPIPGITIDPLTGQIDFFPTVQGNFVVVILIKEWDSNGNLIGTVMHQLQFEVVNCNNQVINCTSAGAIDSLTGNVIQTGPTSLEMCETDTAVFQIGFQDPDIGDSLGINSNILSVLPGATWTVSYPNAALGEYDTVVAEISWVPPVGSANTTNAFIVTVQDYTCPVSGQQTIVYYIDVLGITQVYADTVICNQQWANLHVDVDIATTYTWTAISGDPIVVGSNFSCNNCTSPVASPAVTTVYEVETDGVCSAYQKDTVTVEVVPDYQYNVALGDTNLCFGETTPITTNVVPAVTGYTFQWSQPGDIIGDTLLDPNTPGENTVYYYVTSPQGCVEYDSIYFDYNPDPVNDVVVTSPSCNTTLDGVITINPLTGDAPYTYTLNGVGTQSTNAFSPLAPGAYTFEYVDSNGCVATGSATVPVGPGIVVLAANTYPTSCPGAGNGAVQLNGYGTPGFVFNLSGPTTVSSTNGYISGLPAGTYSVQLVDTLGCLGNTSFTIGNGPGINMSVVGSDETCDGVADGSLTVSSSGTSPITYDITGPTTASNSTGTFSGLPAGTYTVAITDANGCTDLETFTINGGVIQNGNAIAAATSCSYSTDGSVVLSTTNGAAPHTYSISGPVSQTNTTGSFSSLPGGVYSYTVTDDNGCAYTNTFVISNPAPVIASFTPSPNNGLEPLTVFFDNNSSNAVNYFWYFDDGNTSTDPNPSNTFLQGTYSAMLVAQNGTCFDTTYHTIVVVFNSVLYIPNVITPNADGLNDDFHVYHEGIETFHCEIYNRWGTKIYEYDDPDGNWDGSFEGKKVSEGTYFYVINAKGIEGKEYTEKGTINVFHDK